MNRFLRSRWYVVVIYFLFGTAWILLSDVAEYVFPEYLGHWYQTIKGLLFVASTTLLIFTIITHQQKRIREALQEAQASNKTKSDYLIISSHELRTPLNVMEGLIHLLEQNPTEREKEKYYSFLRIAHDNLHQIVNSVLELEDSKTGRITVNTSEVFDAISIVNRCFETYSTAFSERNFFIELHSDYCYVTGDLKRFEQSIMQLISNAVKFTDNDCEIRIKTESNEQSFQVLIQDDGSGLPTDKVESIFKEFSQYGNVLRRSHHGIGVGLALVRFFIEEMGGKISALNSAGKGTHIQIELPVSESDAVTLTEPLTETDNKPLNILLVDDDPLSLFVEQKMLTSKVHTVATAQDGKQAIEQVFKNHNQLDVIFMDVIMPVMDGLQAIREIRKFETKNQLSPVRIVIVSANAFDSDREAGYRAGADFYLIKPVNSTEMLEKAMYGHQND